MHGHSSEMLMKLQLEPEKIKGLFLLGQSLLLEELTIHRCDYHLAVSGPLLGRLLAHGVRRSRTLVLRNGVDIGMFKPRGAPRTDGFTVCYAGDYQVWQGVDLLVQAARMVTEPGMRFRFIGFRQSPEHGRWKDRIRAALGGRAELIDRLPHQELVQQLESSALLVLPRPRHNATEVALPTKFAEYVALGKPVVVTEVDETAQFVRRYECGLVCPPTARGLAQAIGQARRASPEQLRAMGARGRRLAEAEFSWDVICRRYYDFLKTIEREYG
jgi:glycosyltransferase involved in cell wall biosynthesis